MSNAALSESAIAGRRRGFIIMVCGVMCASPDSAIIRLLVQIGDNNVIVFWKSIFKMTFVSGNCLFYFVMLYELEA
jgi:hypothetical protein